MCYWNVVKLCEKICKSGIKYKCIILFNKKKQSMRNSMKYNNCQIGVNITFK